MELVLGCCRVAGCGGRRALPVLAVKDSARIRSGANDGPIVPFSSNQDSETRKEDVKISLTVRTVMERS